MAGIKKVIIKWILVSIYLQFIFLLMIRPFLASIGNTRADFFANIGQFNRAISHYNRVLWIDSKNISALIWCGFAYEDINDLKTAKSYYLRAIKDNPNRNEGYYFLANLFMRERQADQAKIYFQKAAQYQGEYQKLAKQAVDLLNSTSKSKTIQ